MSFSISARILLLLAPAAAFSFAQSAYSVTDICSPHTCQAITLNDNGAVTGSTVDGSQEGFAFYPGTGLVNITAVTGVPSIYPLSMNNSNVIVGGTNGSGPNYCFVYIPGSTQLLDLNPVFRWTFGNCTFINDHGDIAGFGFPYVGGGPSGLVPGYAISEIFGIADTGEVIFVGSGPNTVVYSPGAPRVTQLSGMTVFTPIQFNEVGHVVEYPLAVSGGELTNLLLYVPGAGETELPIPVAFNTYGVNNADEIVGNLNGVAYYYTKALGLQTIQSLVPAGSGWIVSFVWGLNNNGQILADAAKNGVTTSVLLTPPPSVHAARPSAVRRPVRPVVRSLNGKEP